MSRFSIGWASIILGRSVREQFRIPFHGHRRQARINDLDLGDDEVALVLSLMNDASRA